MGFHHVNLLLNEFKTDSMMSYKGERMLNQKDAVTSNILAVLSERDVEYKMGSGVSYIKVDHN